jgi:GNAT superfamily N-acetyltransferase
MLIPDGYADLASLDAAISAGKPDVIIARYFSTNIIVPRWLAGLDQSVIQTPSLVYWEAIPARYSEHPLPIGITISRVSEDPHHRDTAVEVIGAAFTAYLNHYSYNPLLLPELSLAGYQEWAQRTVRSNPDESYLMFDTDGPVGVATMKTGASPGADTEAELVGLISRTRGQGLYEHLLAACIARTQEIGARRMVISTQSTNPGVQRAWARMGLLPFSSIETAHIVKPTLLKHRPH